MLAATQRLTLGLGSSNIMLPPPLPTLGMLCRFKPGMPRRFISKRHAIEMCPAAAAHAGASRRPPGRLGFAGRSEPKLGQRRLS